MDAELLDLLQQDIYTDAHEYADRVRRVKELIAEEVKRAADQKSERNERIRGMAKDEWHTDGEIEVDSGAIVSEGDDNGAYVQAWVWVSFYDTELDKEPGQ